MGDVKMEVIALPTYLLYLPNIPIYLTHLDYVIIN